VAYKKLSYRRRRVTARRTFSLEIWSTQLPHNCQKSHLKRLAIGEWPWKSLKVSRSGAIRWTVYYFLLVVCSSNVSILHHFRDIITLTVYVTAYNVENLSSSIQQLKLQLVCVCVCVCVCVLTDLYVKQTFTPFTGASFVNDSLLQQMLHVSHPLFQFADITSSLLSTAAFFSRFCSHWIQIWAIMAASYLARSILRSRVQYAIENGSSYNIHLYSPNTVEKKLAMYVNKKGNKQTNRTRKHTSQKERITYNTHIVYYTLATIT